MEKITKKEFRTLLETKQDCLVQAFYQKKSMIEFLDKRLPTLDVEQFNEFRTAKRIQTNAIQFSNDSSICFNENGDKSYYRLNNFLISETITLNDFGSVKEETFGYIIYLIK